MSKYIVGLDRVYEFEADSPEEAEAKLAERLSSGDLDIGKSDCVTYEKLPTE